MTDCEQVREVLDAAAVASGQGPPGSLTAALLHAVRCTSCGERDLGQLVPHDYAQDRFATLAEQLDQASELAGELALVALHVAVCDDCAAAFGEVFADADDRKPSFTGDPERLGAVSERVAAEFLSEDAAVVRHRAARLVEQRVERMPETDVALARSGPSPQDYRHIALLASSTLRQGPMNSLAQLIRELTPYLARHQPHLYTVEGSYRMLLRCGLLRDYPPELIHCLAPGRRAGVVDLGAGLVGGPVAGLDGLLGEHHEEIAFRLDLDWKIDCVVHLIDPVDPTSTMPETLALRRECARTGTPFLDTYTTAVEFFGLLGSTSAGAPEPPNAVPADLREPFGYTRFPHKVLALVADDASNEAVLEFARENLPFLDRFGKLIGTATTAALLNGVVPDRIGGEAVKVASQRLADARGRAGIGGEEWVQPLTRGRDGDDHQIAEAVAMGACDCVILLEDPRPDAKRGVSHQLIERCARTANQPDDIGECGRRTLLHDSTSAHIWAELWGRSDGGGPATLETAFRELFNVKLVLAQQRETDQWEAICEEAAWCLLSAIGSKRSAAHASGEDRRVTVGCGQAMVDIVDAIDDVALKLCRRIFDHHLRFEMTLDDCVKRFPAHAAEIDRLMRRRRLTIAPVSDTGALWAIGPVVVAPIVGRFGAGESRVEANAIAGQLARRVEGSSLTFDANAFTRDGSQVSREMRRHWAATTLAVLTCQDLSQHWFPHGDPVALQSGMHADLDAKGAVGEVTGLYLDAGGREVAPESHVRNGMSLEQLRAVARAGGESAAILVAGASGSAEPGPRAPTALAAINGGIVSVLVTDPCFAVAVLREEARRRLAADDRGLRRSERLAANR